MRKGIAYLRLATLVCASTLAPFVTAQEVHTNSTPQAISDLFTVTSEIVVPPSKMITVITDVDVVVDITHTFDADLDVFLTSPVGTVVELFTDVGDSEDNFTNTILDDEAATAIVDGIAPFSGSFRPEGSLSDFDSQSSVGTWVLSITDDVAADEGVLNEWSIVVEGIGPAPTPTGVNATTGAGVGEINLSWNAAAGATSYRIHYDEDGSNPPFDPADNGIPTSGSDVGNNTQITISGLTPGANYNCAVTAIGPGGESGFSAIDDAAAADVPSPPPTPIGFSATTGAAAGQINLSWNSVVGTTGYKVHYDEDGTNPPFDPADDGNPASGTNVGNVSQVTLSGLTPGGAYNCAVTAIGPGGESGFSQISPATAKPDDPQPCGLPALCTNPACPDYSPSHSGCDDCKGEGCAKSALERIRQGTYEEVLPGDTFAWEGSTIDQLQPLAIRVRTVTGVNPESVWITVEGDQGYAGLDSRWRSSETGDFSDGWIIYVPSSPYMQGEHVTARAGAVLVDGSEFGPVTFEFDVAIEPVGSDPTPFVHQVNTPERIDHSIGTPVSATFSVGPTGVYEVPVVVQLPIPEGYRESDVELFYFSESQRHRGWYRASAVTGLIVPNSREVIYVNGRAHLQCSLNHSAFLQFGVPSETAVASIGSFAIGARGGVGTWVIFALTMSTLVIGLARWPAKQRPGDTQ